MAMSSEWKTELEDGSVVVRTCGWSPPGDHPVGCGMKLTIKDGKLVHVEGDEEHSITGGRLCPRCLALKDVVYHPDRILYPMKRDPKDRGKDKWEKITWDEAYDMIVEKVTQIKADFGAESIVVYGGTGREACLYYYPLAFAVLQTPNCCYTQSGWSCYGPRCSVSEFIFGAGYPEIDYAGFFADRFDNPEFELPKYVVCWGKHPLQSNGDGIFGHALVDMMKLGTKIIMVDPRITWLGSRDGNMTVQIKPGTDAALALAVINIMIQEDTYDHEFVDYWCYGFEELAERAAEYTVEKVSEITWVPEEEIIEFAHILGDPANRPASIAWGLAVDQNSNGVQVAQLIITIQALMGVIDVPGGLTIGPTKSMLGSWRMDGIEELAEMGLWDKRIGSHKWLGLANGMATTSPDETLVTAETGEPYELHMAWFNSTNFLAPTCSSQPKRWYNALLKMDFNVVQDLWMTPTAMGLADLFLPLPTFAEHDGIVLPHYGRNTVFMGAMNEAFRVGDTKSDIEVLIDLGKRLNPKAWQFEDVEDFFTKQCEEMGFTFDDLRHKGLYQPGYTYKKYEKGMLRQDGGLGFNTPTGRIEFKSTLYPIWGEDALPFYEEPRFSQVSQPEMATEYPLMMTTGSRKYTSFHSEHRQIDILRRIDKWPEVQVHPETAAKYGLQDGDWAEISNMFGSAKAKVVVTPLVDPRIVNATHGWWFPEQDGEAPNLFGVWKSNLNSMIPNLCIGKLGFGAPYKGIMCKIQKSESVEA